MVFFEESEVCKVYLRNWKLQGVFWIGKGDWGES